MRWTHLFFSMMIIFIQACERSPRSALRSHPDISSRIVSLDFCADQFVLKLSDRKNIIALSPDATKDFSYMRNEAQGIATVRPRLEDVLLLKPDIVVQSYDRDPRSAQFFERTGIKVIQIGYANDIADIENVIRQTAIALGEENRGETVISEMRGRLENIKKTGKPKSILYLTSKGAVAGKNTMIDSLIKAAGHKNFENSFGWRSLPLEKLAYQSPDIVASGFFESGDLVTDRWTPARHSVATRLLATTKTYSIPGAWTACNSWSLVDVVEELATLDSNDGP